MEEETDLKERVDELSVEQINQLIEIMKISKEERGRKHIPGRYNKLPFYVVPFSNYLENDEGQLGYHRLKGRACRNEKEYEFIIDQQNAYLTLIDRIHYLNDGWWPDWENDQQCKWFFRFNILEGFDIISTKYLRIYKDELYFRSKTIGQQLLFELEAEIKLALWGIE